MGIGEDRRALPRPRMRSGFGVVVVAGLSVLIGACASATARATAVPTESPTTTPSPTATATATPRPTPTATVSPSPTASPPAIGDLCLVGRWTLTSLVITDTTTVPGATLTIAGEVGAVLTLGVDGTEIFDLTNSTPLSGSGGGHTISWLGRGVQRFLFYGERGSWAESGPPQTTVATNLVVDGARRPDLTSVKEPAYGSYTCSGSNLTMKVVTVNPPYAQTAVFKK